MGCGFDFSEPVGHGLDGADRAVMKVVVTRESRFLSFMDLLEDFQDEWQAFQADVDSQGDLFSRRHWLSGLIWDIGQIVSIDKFRKGVISGIGYISLVEMGSSDGNSDGNSEEVVAAVLQMLADARRKKGLTQENLSELSGVDHGVISRAERGLRTPSMAAIRDLAVALDFDFAKLVRKAENRVRKNRG